MFIYLLQIRKIIGFIESNFSKWYNRTPFIPLYTLHDLNTTVHFVEAIIFYSGSITEYKPFHLYIISNETLTLLWRTTFFDTRQMFITSHHIRDDITIRSSFDKLHTILPVHRCDINLNSAISFHVNLVQSSVTLPLTFLFYMTFLICLTSHRLGLIKSDPILGIKVEWKLHFCRYVMKKYFLA